ncbi:PilW family protein [Aquabacterium sp.]|uniref:PilW family protein n=1 Tax=Aquabacterium sp. TaxID=1872578 RepID=UPI003D6CACCE
MRVRGFTLIELMVAVALGLVATIVIAQVFLQSEGNKRSTTAGSDAQVAGASALFSMQRDIQMAGYGLTGMPAAVGCPTTAKKSGTAVLTSDPLVPVHIASSGSNKVSDTVTVLYSQGAMGYSVPIKVTETHLPTDPSFLVPSTWGVTAGDLLVVAPATWTAGTSECTLFQATASTDATRVKHDGAVSWNTNLGTTIPAAGYPAGSVLLNLGSAPVRRRYSVNTGTWNLQGLELGASDARDLFPQIVLLKALYGKASVANGPVVKFEVAAPATNADWRLVQAIRIVVVARSAQRENLKDPKVTAAANLVWDMGPLAVVSGSTACNGNSKCLTLDVSATGTDWEYYRYKIFDAVVPMRNAVWNQ